MRHVTRFAQLGTALVLAAAFTAAGAQDRHGGRPGVGGHGPGRGAGHAGGPGVQFDHRYQHDRYYPSRGYSSRNLPAGALSVGWHGGNYFVRSGVWYRPFGPRFVVSVPPIGIFLPLLPFAYTSLWIAGSPYYYANGTYYAPAPGGYTVVAPPPGADEAQPLPAPLPAKALPDPIIYPRSNQSAEQTEADRQQCNTWATTQPSAVSDASVFQRAVAACMDGRGYTVR